MFSKENQSERTVAVPRLVPAVTFGLGVAVLAGVIVTAPSSSATAVERVLTTAALSGPINDASGGGNTAEATITACCAI